MSALVFYLVAAAIMFVNCVLLLILYKNSFYIYYLDWSKNPKNSTKNDGTISEQEKFDYGLLEN